MVRHGLMVVGDAYGLLVWFLYKLMTFRLCGKSCILKVLAEAMTRTATEKSVEVCTMNPKSITQGQLYGSFDDNTHEWTDGVLAVSYRNAAKDTSGKR